MRRKFVKLRLILWILIVYTLGACSASSTAGLDTPAQALTLPPQASAVITPATTPEFLDYVWPAANTSVNRLDYEDSLKGISPHRRGVGVALWAHKVDSPGSNPTTSIIERSTLLIDGNPINDDSLIIGNGLMADDVYDQQGNLLYRIEKGPYYLSWAPQLGEGTHEIKFTVARETGEVLDFKWDVTITN